MIAAPGSRWWLWSARWWPSLPVATTQELMPSSDVTHVNRIDQPHVCSFRPGRTPCFFRAVAASALPTLVEIPSAKVRPLQQTIWTYRSFWSTHAAHARGLTCYVSSTSLYLSSNTQQAPKVSKWREGFLFHNKLRPGAGASSRKTLIILSRATSTLT
jgi:hypothetical protein